MKRTLRVFPRRTRATPDDALSVVGCCVYRLSDGCQCKRSATELTTWGAFCWQHASPRFAIRSLTQGQANIVLSVKNQHNPLEDNKTA